MADFKPAFEKTMKIEDPHLAGSVTVDAGGRTRFGIAEKFHADLPEEFFSGEKEEALLLAKSIMESQYWERLNLKKVADQGVANKIFDMAVNMGTHQAAVLAQRAVNFCAVRTASAKMAASEDDEQPITPELPPLKEDGVIGPKTIEQINAANSAMLLTLLREFSESLYRHIATNNPAQAVNLEGWLKRAAA